MYVELIDPPPHPDGAEGTLAIIVHHDGGAVAPPGATFITKPDDVTQLGVLHHPAGAEIGRHVHPTRTWAQRRGFPQEVIVTLAGKVKVHFYTSAQDYVGSRTLGAGDVLLMLGGGHGFTVLEDWEAYEVRPGPYRSLDDKVRF